MLIMKLFVNVILTYEWNVNLYVHECWLVYEYIYIYICTYKLIEIYDERHELAMTNDSMDGNMYDERIMSTWK